MNENPECCIFEVFQRIGNKYLRSRYIKGWTYINIQRKEDVGLKHYEKEIKMNHQ